MVTYKIQADIILEPVWHADPPEVSVTIGEHYQWHGYLESTKTFSHQWRSPRCTENIRIKFLNKKDDDTIGSLDKAVIIKSLSFNGIESVRFLFQGKYRPIYPELWATEQKNSGIDLPAEISSQTYLGWNGEWIVEFDVPVFTWIHQVEGLGWIYD